MFSAIKRGGSFKARSTEFVPSKHYFIRVKNTDFNYSNNPSFVFNGKEEQTYTKMEMVQIVSIGWEG